MLSPISAKTNAIFTISMFGIVLVIAFFVLREMSSEKARLGAEEGRLEAEATPLPDNGLVISDSNTCLWSVVEEEEGLRLIRHPDSLGNPLCGETPATE